MQGNRDIHEKAVAPNTEQVAKLRTAKEPTRARIRRYPVFSEVAGTFLVASLTFGFFYYKYA